MQIDPPAEADRLIIGKMTSAFGVKGWIKIHAHTECRENIFDFQPWWIKTAAGWKLLKLEGGRRHGKHLVAKFEGIDDRTAVEAVQFHDIVIHRDQLPDLDEDDFYWSDIIGLRVYSVGGDDLGVVNALLETGANDVLVVASDADSFDERERLIPYLFGDVVKKVDLVGQKVIVDWDLEF